jgi:hypothetical protein
LDLDGRFAKAFATCTKVALRARFSIQFPFILAAIAVINAWLFVNGRVWHLFGDTACEFSKVWHLIGEKEGDIHEFLEE